MRLLALVALTATAAWVAPAAAQTVPDTDPYYGVSPDPNAPPPPPRHRPAPPAGTTWHAPPPQGDMHMQRDMHMQGDMRMQMQGPPPHAMPQQQTFVVRRAGPGPAMGPEQRRVEYRHIERGGMVPQRWRAPQVEVRNWRMYGFPQPFEGGRWVRYYDDALLIDGDGRVHDSRPGWDWDRYGERWEEDGDGVPVYAGDGDFQPRGRDYEWAERFHREGVPGRHVEERVYMERPQMGPPPPCMRGCGGGYGAAYMGYGPVLVSETTVTEAPVVEQRTWVTYETVRVAVHHRHHVMHRCTCRVAAPPPPPGGGERG